MATLRQFRGTQKLTHRFLINVGQITTRRPLRNVDHGFGPSPSTQQRCFSVEGSVVGAPIVILGIVGVKRFRTHSSQSYSAVEARGFGNGVAPDSADGRWVQGLGFNVECGLGGGQGTRRPRSCGVDIGRSQEEGRSAILQPLLAVVVSRAQHDR